MRFWHSITLVGFLFAALSALLLAPTAQAVVGDPDTVVFEILLPDYGAELAPTHRGADAAIQATAASLGGQWQVYRWEPATGTPAWIYGSGHQLTAPGADDAQIEAAARAFIAAHPDIFQARDEDLVLDSIIRGAGKIGIHFAQTHEGLPVFRGRVRLALGESGKIVAFGSEFHSAIDLDTTPALAAEAAVETAKRAVPFNPAVDVVRGTPELVVVPVPRFEGGAVYRLAWRTVVTTQEPVGEWLTHVDAHTGEIFWRENEVEFLYEGTSKGDVQIPGYCAGSTPNTPFRNQRVVVFGVGPATTDSTGHFEVPGSAGTLTLETEFSGTELIVRNQQNPDAFFSGPIQENVPLNIVWDNANSDPSERDVYYWQNAVHAFLQRVDNQWDLGRYTGNVTVRASGPSGCVPTPARSAT
jgi:hypothetical protein